ncbi:MAG: hypothetical protein QXP98_06365 [Thermoproteus sp.]
MPFFLQVSVRPSADRSSVLDYNVSSSVLLKFDPVTPAVNKIHGP